MKILCLHGFRTNKTIMDKQLNMIKHYMPEHQFITLNGPISTTETYPEIKMYFPDEKVYYEWYNSAESVETCIEYLRPIVLDYDCVLGFSQGACVISQMLQRNIIKRGILIAHGHLQPTEIIGYPCLHLIGKKDELKTYGEQAKEKYSNSKVIYFNDHHKIPTDKSSIEAIKSYLQSYVNDTPSQDL